MSVIDGYYRRCRETAHLVGDKAAPLYGGYNSALVLATVLEGQAAHSGRFDIRAEYRSTTEAL
jgi:hypothetical protein